MIVSELHGKGEEQACDRWLEKIPVGEGLCGDSLYKLDQTQLDLVELHLLEHVVQNSVYLDGKVMNGDKKDDLQDEIDTAVMGNTELYLR